MAFTFERTLITLLSSNPPATMGLFSLIVKLYPFPMFQTVLPLAFIQLTSTAKQCACSVGKSIKRVPNVQNIGNISEVLISVPYWLS